MQELILPVPPIGVVVLPHEPPGKDRPPLFSGISFCQALAVATKGQEVWVERDSIGSCKWSPVVLGFQPPESKFEQTLLPRLPVGTHGVYLAPLERFRNGLTPTVVVVRALPDVLRQMLDTLGWDNAAWDVVDDQRISRSALRRLFEQHDTWRSRLQEPVGKTLAVMRRVPGWTRLTATVFKNKTLTTVFDKVIDRTMADMSICRNSVAIPLLTGKVNVSYYCTGGVAWGENDPLTMTSGWPWAQWQELQTRLGWRIRE